MTVSFVKNCHGEHGEGLCLQNHNLNLSSKASLCFQPTTDKLRTITGPPAPKLNGVPNLCPGATPNSSQLSDAWMSRSLGAPGPGLLEGP